MGSSAGSYRYVASAGVVAESVRVPESIPAPVEPEPFPEAQTPAVTEERVSPPPTFVAKPIRRLSLVGTSVPSMIIDMGEQVEKLVDELLKTPPLEDPPQIPELLRIGESALPVLMQRFPGPLWSDARVAHGVRPPVSQVRGRDLSAVARAVVDFGGRAASYVAGKLVSSEGVDAYYALLVAAELTHPDLLDPVARRLFSEDATMRALAIEVLRQQSRLPQFLLVLQALADISARPGRDPERQRHAVEALAELRDGRALNALFVRLGDTDPAIREVAYQGLVDLTAQDFGDNAAKWTPWVEQVQGTHRVEWLIDSLLHTDASLRALAGEELKRVTQQYFGYHPALPKRDREVSQRKYREWWLSEGRRAFGV